MAESTEKGKKDGRDPRADVLGADFTRLSAVEIGAKRGIGPMSPLGERVWHGESRPCVSCGELVRRTAARCDQCGQLLSGEMIYRMRQYSGPWYVLEHVRPFPGVSKDRLLLQIERKVLTATTIVRGPTTHHQWRYAGETPGLSKYLGLCWACQAPVHSDGSVCPVCRKNLDSDGEEVLIEGDETLAPRDARLDELRAAVQSAGPRRRGLDDPARIAGVPAWWIVSVLVLVLVAAVWYVSGRREASSSENSSRSSEPTSLVLPDLPAETVESRD